MHLRRGDTLCVCLIPCAPHATAGAVLRKVSGTVTVSLDIILCMRKRKRCDDFVLTEEEAGAHDTPQSGQGVGASASLGLAAAHDMTGSDTEWSEGFSSDSDPGETIGSQRRRKRAAPHERRLARLLASHNLEPVSDE